MSERIRFFISQKIGDASEITVADKDIYHQIVRVLRRRKGDVVEMLDNSGFEYRCVIQNIGKSDLTLSVESKELNPAEPEIYVTLYQSLLKKDKMEWVLEKCTEIGVSSFVPVLSEHSVKLGINIDRARKILKEATEQCGRGKIPELSEVMSFKDAVARARAGGALNVFLHEAPEITAGFITGEFKNINLFVGPEGGFSESEVNIAGENNFKIISISQRVLRAETAAIAGSFLCFIK